MTTALLLALVAVNALLTVVLLGTLRGIAAVRLSLKLGDGALTRSSSDLAIVGRTLLPELRDRLPWIKEDGLVLFATSTCSMCWEMVSLLPELRIENVAVAIYGSAGDMLESIPPHVVVLPAGVSESLHQQYAFEAVPFGFHQRDGVIVGTIHSDGLVSLAEIEKFWIHGGARVQEVAA